MEIRNITVKFGEKTVFDNFSLSVPSHKVTCIMGPSGCGKTTLLNVIADSVKYEGQVDKESKNVAFIYQNTLLLKHLTVYQNIDFVLKNQIKDKSERKAIIENILKKVELLSEADSYPKHLSGGMAQRVELARAFAFPSEILLMDEPFSGLDVSLKKRIMEVFLSLLRDDKKTVIMVTHDPDDAILLADHIVILGKNEVRYSCELTRGDTRSVSDYPDVRANIYSLL